MRFRHLIVDEDGNSLPSKESGASLFVYSIKDHFDDDTTFVSIPITCKIGMLVK